MDKLWTWLAMPRHGSELGLFIFGALVIGVIILAMLASVPPRYRKNVVMIVTFVCGLYFAVEFLWPGNNVLTAAVPQVANIEIVVGSFALLVGLWNLFHIHGKAVLRLNKGWYNSAAFFVSFFAIMIAGFLKDYTVAGAPRFPGTGELFGILFGGFLVSLQSTTFSLIAFYIVSAAYRAFRLRSSESVLMMLAATIVMLALVPVGAMLTSWIPDKGILSALRLENMGYWILVWPNMAVQRAIAFGVAVGAMATGLRIWLSLERGSFFDRQL